MRILFVGDIFGRPGRAIVRDHFQDLLQTRKIDLAVANAENAAAGFGITPPIAEDLLKLGFQVLTTGNHVWDKREILEYLSNGSSSARRVLRPANYPASAPGTGCYEGTTAGGVPFAVINAQGRVFMVDNDDPFRTIDSLLQRIQAKVIVVDFHAEATSEKIAMGWYLDGRVTAVLGTHTHVPTADERILAKGTAYVTDVGMTGPYDSIIGVQREQALERFLTNIPNRFEPASGDVRLCATIIDCDEKTGRATAIERLMLRQ